MICQEINLYEEPKPIVKTYETPKYVEYKKKPFEELLTEAKAFCKVGDVFKYKHGITVITVIGFIEDPTELTTYQSTAVILGNRNYGQSSTGDTQKYSLSELNGSWIERVEPDAESIIVVENDAPNYNSFAFDY